MSSDEKFYKFEESSSATVIGGEEKSKSCTRERLCWIFLVLVLIGAVVGVSVYFTGKDKESDEGKTDTQTGGKITTGSPIVTVTTTKATTTMSKATEKPGMQELYKRIDCIPEAQGGIVKATPELCTRRRCVYSDTGIKDIPVCYYDSNQGYRAVSYETTNLGYRVNLEKTVDGPFGSDFETAVFNIEMRGDNLIRFTFDDPVFNRYKVPLEIDLPKDKPTAAKYEIKITSNQTFAFQVIRKSTRRVLWDTGVGGLVLSDQFLQISTKLPSEDVYGFGENLHDTLKHNLSKSSTWPMFSRDQAPSHWNQANLYGVHPFYTCMEDNEGHSHGVFLLNSNAMEYSFSPLPMLTYRTIGGILDFYMFLGPEPENVVQQYTALVGRPYMVPYWSLGFQICRYGYKNLAEIEAVVNSTKEYNIPHDVQYADIDHFDANKDFTLDKTNFGDLPQYFQSLRENGMRTVIILDPALISSETAGYEPYDNLTALRGAVMWPEDLNVADEDKDSTGALLGYVWPSGKSVFPDFFKKETQDLWSRLIVKHRNVVPFDGLWIDMNEPANFGTNLEKPWNWPDNVEPWSLHCPINNQYEDPPYRTKAGYGYDNTTSRVEGRLSDKTICMVSRQGDNGEYRHYDVHSLYGWSETPPTLKGVRAATGERSFVLSRSTYPGSGKYTGHWLGDNDAAWSDLRKSIIGIQEFNLFGIPYVGADICGYWYDGTAELCKRWLQLGAFYPFSRNHNQKDAKDNHPTVYGPEVANVAREALETRYWLLPYLYTLFHKAHTEGSTVVRPLFHEFPSDEFARSVYREFLWGKALLIAPVTDQYQTEVITYLPGGAWYDFYDGHLQTSTVKRKVESNSKIGLYVRGGFILPMQRPANNTAYSRKNPLKLLVSLDDSGSAEGELFWDDGTSIDTYETGNYFYAKFTAQRNSVKMEIAHANTPDLTYLHFEEIQIYGAPAGVTRVYCDGMNLNYTAQDDTNVLTINSLKIPLTRTFTVYWSLEAEDERLRHDCMPESLGGYVKVTKESCESRGCVYKGDASQGPLCYFNSENYGYKVTNETTTDFGYIYHLKNRGHKNPFSDLGNSDIPDIVFSVEFRGNDVFRFKFEDATKKRYEVPIKMNLASTKGLLPRCKIIITNRDPFTFQVVRMSNDEVLWDTGVGGLTFSEQFLQISTKLPSKNIYGFGENTHDSFRHDLNNRMWPMFSRDQPTGGVVNHYGVHPFYMCVEGTNNGGHSHGVLLLNSNAQDYSFSPLPMLTYRTIGGILDFYMFLGPEPENVVQQYTGAIGRPYMPPYWSLGFQLCRYGYNNIENLKDAVNKTKAAGIPHDVQYADIDHMDERMDFTIDDMKFMGLNDYFKSLQRQGMHTIIILDPTLISNVTGYEPYIKMRDTNSNIKWPTVNGHIPNGSYNEKNDLLGFVWPKGKVVFPDFLKNSTKYVWQELIEKHHKNNLTFDGLWIDMNEPANFGTNEEKPWNWPESYKPYWSLNCTLAGNTYEHPPYRTMAAFVYDNADKKTMISEKTICMRAVQGDGDIYKHYDVHSLYGWSQTEPTLDGLRKATRERGIVISRSTFPSSGKYTGHWLGDNNSGWKDLRDSIIGSLEFNLFGIPYIGADICGFFSDTTPELCKRWMQLGAFYTFSRNHNGLNYKRQDPGSLGDDVAEASRIAMETRYRLLPYLYTLFHKAHTQGYTVMRPLHHEFTDDEMTFDIDKQFLWGPSLMISPILYEGQTSINIYIPRGPWYDLYTGEEVDTQNGYITSPVQPDSKIPLHVRAGHIFPMQAPANNTHFSRKNPFTLLVALKDSENGGRGYTAKGDLFWDDGVSIDTFENKKYFYARFSSGHDTLSLTVEHNDPSSAIDGLYIDTVKVFGVRTKPTIVYIGDTSHTHLQYDETKKVLDITNLRLPINQDFHLEWREVRRPTVNEMKRSNCFPDKDSTDVTKVECDKRFCIYDETSNLPYFVPKCYINRTAHGYNRLSNKDSVKDDFRTQLIINKKHSFGTLFGKDIYNLRVLIEKNSNNILHIKITDSEKDRYEAPVELNLPHNEYNNQSLYQVEYSNEGNEFFVKVKRKDTGTVIWDTSVGPLIFSEQYLQISSKLPSKNFYGLGEHRHFHLRHDLDYKTWPIFTRDAAVNSPDYSNLYGAHPFYMNLEDDKGNAHAVLLLNTNAMEVVLEPMPRVTYRTIGGILDFYIFLGQNPEDVIQQYTSVIGHPVMVPYWSLGFQLCRWGYDSLDNLKAAVNRTSAAEIPHDVQYADIDHMDERKDFTYDKVMFAGLPEYIRQLQDGGMHFIIILDPAIISNETNYWPYDTGVSEDVFIKWPNGTGPMDSRPENSDIMLGYVWPKGKVAFPDFLNNRTKDWWSKSITKFHDTLNFDGLWIDMNEPANFDTNGEHPWNWPEKDKPYWTLKCTLDNNTLDIPPYKPRAVTGEYLSEKTLCMVGQQGDGKYNHYDVHSLYGWSEIEPTLRGLRNVTGERGVVISRSTYPTSGRYGAHWLGDNDSFWRNLHDSIIGIIEFNLFGIPFTGADICGFFAEPSVEMCQRWMQLGAFYTFSRNHNGKDMKDQDPAIFGKHVAYSSKIALQIRYSLLPYLYTQFYRVHTEGGTIIRSMMHEFPQDMRTWDVDTQFMWASALLIAPVLEQGHRHKDVYLPDARWFNYHTGEEMLRKTAVTVDAPRDVIPIFIRGGYIVPTQDPANNTVHSRKNGMHLVVVPDDKGKASGNMFWDDGVGIDTIATGNFYYSEFEFSNNNLTYTVTRLHNIVGDLMFNNIWVFGVHNKPSQLSDTNAKMVYNSETKLLWVQDLKYRLDSNFTFSFS